MQALSAVPGPRTRIPWTGDVDTAELLCRSPPRSARSAEIGWTVPSLPSVAARLGRCCRRDPSVWSRRRPRAQGRFIRRRSASLPAGTSPSFSTPRPSPGRAGSSVRSAARPRSRMRVSNAGAADGGSARATRTWSTWLVGNVPRSWNPITSGARLRPRDRRRFLPRLLPPPPHRVLRPRRDP